MRLYQVLDTTDTIQTGDKYPQVGRTIAWECLRPVPEEWVGKEVGNRLIFRPYRPQNQLSDYQRAQLAVLDAKHGPLDIAKLVIILVVLALTIGLFYVFATVPMP